MGTNLQWTEDNQGILLWEFINDWTWDEYHASIKQLLQLAAETDFKRIDIIVDMTHSGGIPAGIISNMLAGNPEETADTSRWGVTVVVGGGVLVRSMLSILRGISKVIREHYMLANTINEARQLITIQRRKHDPSSVP